MFLKKKRKKRYSLGLHLAKHFFFLQKAYPTIKTMLTVTEDFSFPKVSANPIPHFIISPSLWRVTSLVYPDYNLDEDYGRGEGFSRNNFSRVESKTKSENDAPNLESPEEKMDMLWEDFNEELQRESSIGKKKEAERFSRGGGLDYESEVGATKEFVELFCLQALKMSKTSKRINMVVVLKALKKLFFLRN